MSSSVRNNAINFSISNATFLNWQRLNINPCNRLTTRANKSNSTKKILPLEYFSNIKNKDIVSSILDYIVANDISAETALFSLAENMLSKKNLMSKMTVCTVLQSFSTTIPNYELLQYELPSDEYDFLGTVYQCLLLEGKKNTIGSYYTPLPVVKNMTRDFDFSHGELFLDPCCGSGAFLM